MGTNNSLTQCVSTNGSQNYETLECIEWEQQIQEEVTLSPHLIGCWWNWAPIQMTYNEESKITGRMMSSTSTLLIAIFSAG